MAKTDNRAGGLVPMDKTLMAAPRLATPDRFSALPWHEARQYCLMANNQGQKPTCAGQATAGYIEVHEYQETHIQTQYDGEAIYEKAKELEGGTEWGTTLSYAVKGAQALGWLDPAYTIRLVRSKREVQFALHTHLVVIAGFMITEGWNRCNKKNGFVSDKYPTAIGGHAVLLNSYNEDPDEGPLFYGFQNSWGPEWGVKGNGRLTEEQFMRQFLYAAVLEKEE